MAGPLQPRGPRFKWNRAVEARWRRQGEGGHQVVRYNTTQHDGRWLCMRCGLHYVRFCDLRTKRRAGAPANQAAAKAIADALAGGPLTRRKAHAFAKHPSGSRLGAPGARLPSDVVVLDPGAPKPAGPACLRAQGNDLGNQGAVAPEGGPQRTLPAGDPRSRDGSELPVRPMSLRHDEDEADRGTREGNPRPQGVAQAERSPRGQDPTATRHRDTNDPQDEVHGHVDPGDTRQAGECGGGPRDVCSLLGLGPGRGPRRARETHRPRLGLKGGPCDPRPSMPRRSPPFIGPAKPRGCLSRRGTPVATSSAGSCPALRLAALARSAAPHWSELAQHPQARPGPRTGCRVGPWPGPGSVPEILGSSTDPPRGVFPVRPRVHAPVIRVPAAALGILAGSVEGGVPAAACRALPQWTAPRGMGRAPSRTGICTATERTFSSPLSDIPDFFVPFPGRGGALATPRPGRGALGQLEPD